MSPAPYTAESDYRALVEAVRLAPADDAPRLALADWVQDHGDDAEAVAIRGRRSPTIDLIPAMREVAHSLGLALDAFASVAEDFAPAIGAVAEAAGAEVRAAFARLVAAQTAVE